MHRSGQFSSCDLPLSPILTHYQICKELEVAVSPEHMLARINCGASVEACPQWNWYVAWAWVRGKKIRMCWLVWGIGWELRRQAAGMSCVIFTRIVLFSQFSRTRFLATIRGHRTRQSPGKMEPAQRPTSTAEPAPSPWTSWTTQRAWRPPSQQTAGKLGSTVWTSASLFERVLAWPFDGSYNCLGK